METMRNQTTCRFNPQKGYAITNDSTENFANQQTNCMRREKQNIIYWHIQSGLFVGVL